ncbi:hypothetical protein HH308_28530 [Gordonia sp. TBRC 11910]|uniref:Lipoprotein n=1 Tax=Gordonia asplenii TaxID=2725283 RepID=A0A848L2C5_9ACTN|nr:hypothetical protein [Gordonia asplenii]NMO05170.1 hypothetical protein [Gordonia asplenii]
MTAGLRRRTALTVVAAALAVVAVAGCGSADHSAASSSALPACSGVATSDYGLGDALASAAAKLAALPHRVATGTATVLRVDGAKAPLRVAITVCGDGLDDDSLKDVASTLAVAVAGARELGNQVGALSVELQSANKVAQADPFNAASFASGTDVATVRGQWRIEQN